MGKLIARTELKREKEKIYYVKEDEDGNLGIWCAEMVHGGRKKK